MAAPYQGRPGEVIDPDRVEVFRGGPKLAPGLNDVRIRDDMVQTSHGVSLDTDRETLERFGGAYRVIALPAELVIMQKGRRLTHFEIVPVEPMTLDRYEELLEQVQLEEPE